MENDYRPNEIDDEVKKPVINERRKKKKTSNDRIVRRILRMILLAIIFGAIASVTFLVTQPFLSDVIYPTEDEQEVIVLPAEADEISPEDMIQEQVIPEQEPAEQEDVVLNLSETEYMEIYESMHDVAMEAKRSIVTVSGVSSDVDWFDNSFESKGEASGVILAEGEKELLVLVEDNVINGAEQILVTFVNGEQASATLKEKNEDVGFAVVSVLSASLDESTKDLIQVATTGSSNGSNLPGTPIIAIGSPDGHTGSVCYGMITSAGYLLQRTDNNLHLMKTDIYGSEAATGVIVNLKGQVLGMIHQEETGDEMQNCIVAIGMSDLRDITETMSNGKKFSMAGIKGMNVSEQAHEELGVPYGAFVTEVVIGSPAMNAGIQSGDVIVDINADPITFFSDYTKTLHSFAADTDVVFTIMRQSNGEYSSLNLIVHLETLN